MEESPQQSHFTKLVMKWSIISVKSTIIFHINCSREALVSVGLTHHAIFCLQFPTNRCKKSELWKTAWVFPKEASFQ